jgi:hypothetical protein
MWTLPAGKGFVEHECKRSGQSYLRPVSAAYVAAGPDVSPQIRSPTT